MDDKMKMLIRCPFCQSDWRMLVEERIEGHFQCLQCNRRFVLPSTIKEIREEPSILGRVMP